MSKAGVYFIANPERSMVKIGKSTDVASRFGDLSRMNAGKIELLAVVRGYSATERFFHEQWKHLRSHGEWFHLDEALGAFIADAANDEDITVRLCPGPLNLDRIALARRGQDVSVATMPAPPPPAEPEKFANERDILAAWRRFKGYDVTAPREIEWGALALIDQQHIGRLRGAWLHSGQIYHTPYAGILPVAHQLAAIKDPDERTLALIHASVRDTNDMVQLHSKHHGCTEGVLRRRIAIDNRAKHWLPTDHARCDRCRGWRDSTAGSALEWLERLAHIADLKGLTLARIINGPVYDG